ncbi:MAG TPA: CDP-alcohol phosphatidyltransferase family protein [Egibacteraceae bacterium]|nr:CDP-alcohol phosphatidyltransferase family protein [Egibacteraceae bacterium]
MRRDFDWGARKDRPAVVHDKVLTVANGISLARLAGLPLFVWLMFGPQAYGWAWFTLFVVGSTDFLDGYVARRFDQVTKLGKLLDPLIDRGLMATVAISLLAAGMLPWFFVAAILGRDLLILLGTLAFLRAVPEIAVTRTGKFATACLLIGLPGFLLGHMDWPARQVFLVLAWGYTTVGVAGYWIAGLQYARIVRGLRGSGA